LVVESSKKVTDKPMIALADGCKKLKDLNMEGTSVSDEGIVYLAAACPDLADLNISNCDDVTGAGLEAAEGGFKNARIQSGF
jgi:hypothetical protein